MSTPLERAHAALRRGDAAGALAAADAACAADPSDPKAQLARGQALAMAGQRNAALAAAQSAAAAGADARDLGDAAGLLIALEAYGEAETLLTRALGLAANDARLLRARAGVRRFLGDFAGAEADYDLILEAAHDDANAHLMRAQLRTQSAARNHVAAIEAALARARAPEAAIQLHYAAAKELEDLGAHAQSFAHLAKGAALKRASLRYDVRRDAANMARIARAFATAPAPARAAHDKRAIFVLGMPRTGSTLIERILSAHPAVESAGELRAFPAALYARASAEAGAPLRDTEALIDASPGLAMDALGAAYLARARPHLKTGRAHFVDKAPWNFMHAALIAAALPDAAIVHVTRHPMANGYGMFRTLFADGYSFSYDLAEIADYLSAYRALMAHWRALLGPRLIEIAYEDLVADQEGASRALLAACGLEWDDACLAFHRNPAPATTQSAVQVRAPIDARARDSWRAYAGELEPLRARLIANGWAPAAFA